MRISKILEIPSVKLLLFLFEKNEVRHGNFSEMIASRGTLSYSLKELEVEGLLERRVVPTKPIQSYYSLTEKGKAITKMLDEIRSILNN